jgi:ribonuclease P protein component
VSLPQPPLPQSPRQDLSFPRACRIVRREEFDHVRTHGLRRSEPGMTLWLLASERETPRLGVIVGRKTGSAPARNRAKRVLREAFRTLRPRLANLDIVAQPRPGARLQVEAVRQALLRHCGDVKT